MKPERYRQIEGLYHEALEREPEERAAFLAQACEGDEELHQEVESLLGYDERAEHFIERPPDDVAAAMLAGEQKQSMLGRTLGHYHIVSPLGAGGMGEVYLAEDTRLDRKVAIKFLPAESTADEQAKKRLIREAQAAARLDHPNICSIHEVGEEDGCSFIVMQYVEGETLAAELRRKAMELAEVVNIASQVGDALAEAHLRGIIHRDIKPGNIMITARRQAKLMDFGLARTVAQRSPTESEAETASLLTEPGTIIGTMPYMSPEQVRGGSLDARSDIFSFGAVLYEMISGRQPFAAESAAATYSAILTLEPPPLARYAAAVPAEMQRIVRKCLEKDREDRYQSARDLLIDLRNLKRESESVSVISESVAQRARSRLSKPTYAALAVSIVALAGIMIFVLARGGKLIDSVAILPFVNANAEPQTEYLADGIPESIINSLSQLPHLKVMSRNSVFRYKGREIDAQEVGQKLGVQAVLTGRIAQRGESLAISIELVDVRDNSQIWGQQYTRKLADVFAVQEEIAQEISEKLRVKLSGAERQQLARRPTENLQAFQYYMQGRSYAQRSTGEDLVTAIHYYEKAIDEDRNYALAYAGLTDGYAVLGARGHIAPIEGRRKAEEAARKALALDDSLAEAHAALGQTYMLFAPYNLSLGDRELRRAIELSPSLALAHQYLGLSLLREGRLDESLAELLKARELDPLSSIIARLMALPYYLKRDYVRAMELLRQAKERGPALSTTWEIGVYIQNRLFDEALAELEKAKRERKSDPILIYSTGTVYAARGERAEALQIIKELEEMSGTNLSQAVGIAKIYATLNQKELAFLWLERGLATGAIGAFYKEEPVWDTIRSDPRYADLLRRMGIPQ
jgi:serine/threonine protein kinase/tetratricopeptide (TPR) repeat protein